MPNAPAAMTPRPDLDSDEFLTLAEAAARLQIHIRTLRKPKMRLPPGGM